MPASTRRTSWSTTLRDRGLTDRVSLVCSTTLVEGDVLTVWKLDRLGRSVSHLLHLVDELGRRGVQFRSLTEALDTTTSGGRLLFHVVASVAEFERNMAQERTAAALARARAQISSGVVRQLIKTLPQTPPSWQ